MRVNFKHPKSRKDRKQKRLTQVSQAASGFDVNMVADEPASSDLSKAKRKQVFKKSKARDLKA